MWPSRNLVSASPSALVGKMFLFHWQLLHSIKLLFYMKYMALKPFSIIPFPSIKRHLNWLNTISCAHAHHHSFTENSSCTLCYRNERPFGSRNCEMLSCLWVLYWGHTSRLPHGSSCNASRLTCCTRGASRWILWRGPECRSQRRFHNLPESTA